jgi:hypothetical protein
MSFRSAVKQFCDNYPPLRWLYNIAATAWGKTIRGLGYCFYKLSGAQNRIHSLKDTATGKRCFVIGNGPSLSIADLERLSNEVTFCSNTIYGAYSKTDWRPNYYAMIDVSRLKSTTNQEFSYIIDNTEHCFLPWHCYRTLSKEIRTNPSLFMLTPYYLGEYLFSNELENKFYVTNTVTLLLLQLAAYVGFKEIYLLGVDCSYAVPADGNVVNQINYPEFIAEKSIEFWIDTNTWHQSVNSQRHYQIADDYSQAHGFRIYNATRGGNLEAFERVDFDSLFPNES